MKHRNRKLCKHWHKGDGRPGGYCAMTIVMPNGVKAHVDGDCEGVCGDYREKNKKEVKK